MASNITTSSTFATANMRVDPGEQADALWADKMADNDGYNYYKEIPLADLAPTATGEARFIFTKRASHNGLKSLSRGLAGGAVTEYMRVFAEGSDPTTLNAYAVAGTLAYTRAAQATQRFDLDISGLTNGNVYLVTYKRDISIESVRPEVFLTYGSNASY